MSKAAILVTGGAGYIGSHVVEALQQHDYLPIVYDNLSTGHGAAVPEDVQLIEGDVHDSIFLRHVLEEYQIEGVMHFAASIEVGESMANPAKYYYNNVIGSFRLLEAMREVGVERLVFSSTAAVYGQPASLPISEDSPTVPTSVYGRTKLIIEGLLQDYAAAYGLNYVALRYFNAAGASPTREIGEDHNPESHLIPLILKTALGLRQNIQVYGEDYPTPDGTCIRDYIHVCDLATAHVLALEHLLQGGSSRIYNLGSQQGFSVGQVIKEAKAVTQRDIPVVVGPRRPGDPASLVASSAKIQAELGWQLCHSRLTDIIATAWRWHEGHPHGYAG